MVPRPQSLSSLLLSLMVYGNHGIHWALFVWGHFNRSHSDQKYAFHLQRYCYYLYLYDIRWCRCEGLMDWAQNIWEDQYDISEMTETRDLDVIALKCWDLYEKISFEDWGWQALPKTWVISYLIFWRSVPTICFEHRRGQLFRNLLLLSSSKRRCLETNFILLAANCFLACLLVILL